MAAIKTQALAAGLILCAGAQMVQAHPHIFVDSGLEVLFDENGQPEALRISWRYDPFFSMLLVSDMGLDPDFSGTVTEAEQPLLDGFDMQWIAGYHGDTHVTQNGQSLALSGPVEWTSEYRDGRLYSSHLREFVETPDPALEWTVSIHDPSYYTSYTINDAPQITGRDDCRARIFEPDWDAAGAQLEAALDEVLGAGGDIEVEFPPVGALFSEEVRITCAQPS
ncbi:DUF1007 family protein [Roseinatronobacter alkalisoli]|uniref:DUF1007 family protein n=1 Tax=Roseinatronobacter alkalisoli TaxID=3028235 RepID=A0ABT5T6L8_9RHOB|nr:DUF1007 family protein [Roseinatronobacter sp. HJB301]MDD7970769.1 DUF1007 family protein [Roseinatronobacter sp. HJB301]